MGKPLRLGIAGLGTVGASVVRIIQSNLTSLTMRAGRPVTITAVSARNRNRDRGIDVSGLAWYDDPVAMVADPNVDVVVELIGGATGAAEDLVRAAIAAGKPVITANKALLARHGVELARLAEVAGVSIGFEAAVAGGIPVIKTLKESLSGNTVTGIVGILNGTCNYILTRMEKEQLSFETCLAEAQRLGYAEADPTFDIGGFDTAHKLAILTSLAFGTEVDADAINVEGITSISLEDIKAAEELGYRIKLLGVARRTESGIEASVHPAMVPKKSVVAQTSGVLNAVSFKGDVIGEVVLVGPGAGGNATASSVIADIVDLASDRKTPVFGLPVGDLMPYQKAEIRAHKGGYYVRLSVYDRPGAFAGIAKSMADREISLESIVQHRRAGDDEDAVGHTGAPQPVVLITYATRETDIRAALDAIEAAGHIATKPTLIRIESL